MKTMLYTYVGCTFLIKQNILLNNGDVASWVYYESLLSRIKKTFQSNKIKSMQTKASHKRKHVQQYTIYENLA